MSETTYSLDDLAERSETPARTIRYYIQRGLVSRPVGEKRGAHYTPGHLRQLLQIRKWVGAGLSLQRIAGLLQEEGLAAGSGLSTDDLEIVSTYTSAREAAPAYALERPMASVASADAPAYPAAQAAATTAAPASGRSPDPARTTLKHHLSVAPGIELVIDPARQPLTPEQTEALVALLRDHLPPR